jgi:arylsulfatase A-like enzyme
VYDENLHVPLLVHGTDDRSRVNEVITLKQLPCILSAAAGISNDDMDAGPDTSGEPSFGAQQFTTPIAISKTEEAERVAIHTQEWKYIRGGHDWEYVRGVQPEELYHLRSDPGEQQNVIQEYPAVAAELRAYLGQHKQEQRERDGIAGAVHELDNLFQANGDRS